MRRMKKLIEFFSLYFFLKLLRKLFFAVEKGCNISGKVIYDIAQLISKTRENCYLV